MTSKLIITSLLYSILLLFASFFIITLLQPLHQPFIGSSEVHDDVFDFFYSGNTSFLGETNMTQNEISHMVDVRNLLINVLIGIVLLTILLVILFFTLTTIERKVMYLTPFGFFLFMLLPTAFTDFNKLFFVFHEVFFPQGNYAFPYDSVLIQTYPGEFFALMGLFGVLLYLILASLKLVGYEYIIKKFTFFQHEQK